MWVVQPCEDSIVSKGGAGVYGKCRLVWWVIVLVIKLHSFISDNSRDRMWGFQFTVSSSFSAEAASDLWYGILHVAKCEQLQTNSWSGESLTKPKCLKDKLTIMTLFWALEKYCREILSSVMQILRNTRFFLKILFKIKDWYNIKLQISCICYLRLPIYIQSALRTFWHYSFLFLGCCSSPISSCCCRSLLLLFLVCAVLYH